MHSCDLIHTEQVISDLLRGDAGSWQEIEQDNTWYVIVRQVHTYLHVWQWRYYSSPEVCTLDSGLRVLVFTYYWLNRSIRSIRVLVYGLFPYNR